MIKPEEPVSQVGSHLLRKSNFLRAHPTFFYREYSSTMDKTPILDFDGKPCRLSVLSEERKTYYVERKLLLLLLRACLIYIASGLGGVVVKYLSRSF